MKMKFFPLIAAALLVLASCSQMNEQKYNDTVVKMYASYSNNITSEMSAVGNTSDKQHSLAGLKSMRKTTDSCIQVMNDLKPSEAARDFHQKVLTVFQTVKAEFIPLAEKMVNMSGTEDVDAYNKLISEFNTVGNKITRVESEAQTAQQAYVSKVGMHIE